jgi:uncharacterized membrane protein
MVISGFTQALASRRDLRAWVFSGTDEMKVFEHSVEINSPSQVAWSILADLSLWPAWTASMEEVRILDGSAAQLGVRVRIKQPSLRAVVMTIDDWQEGRAFSWSGSSGGVLVRADHVLQPDGRHCVFTQRLVFLGAFSRPVAWFMGSLVERYMGMEADGLKAASQASYQAASLSSLKEQNVGGKLRI